MTLFHFFSFPLFAVLLVAIDFRRNEDNKKLAGYFIKGMALYIPAFVVFLLFKAWISVSYNPIYMYLRVFFLDHFFYFIVVIAGFILIQGLDNLERVEFLQLAVFSTGFYAVAGVEAILQNTGVYNMYLLFFLPLLRFAIIVLSSLLFMKIFYSFGLLKIGYIVGLFSLSFLAAVVSHLNEIHRTVWAFAICIIFLVLSFAIKHFSSE